MISEIIDRIRKADSRNKLGISKSTLNGWRSKYYSVTSNMEDIVNLRKENLRLKQERDILKKAAAYFARTKYAFIKSQYKKFPVGVDAWR